MGDAGHWQQIPCLLSPAIASIIFFTSFRMTDRTPAIVGLSLLSWTSSVLAQGQGSYGGIGDGFVQLALWAILGVAALAAFVIRALFGTKVMLVVVVVTATWLGVNVYRRVDQQKQMFAVRKAARQQIDQSLAQGCAGTMRQIEHPARGDEPVYIRLHGAELATRHWEVVPRPEYLAQGVEILAGEPPAAGKGIVVDITYTADWVRSDDPDSRFQRLRYDLAAKTFPEGTLVASTTDMTAGEGFCLEDFEDFLRRALNRPQVSLRGQQRALNALSLPDTYVQSTYAAVARGIYLKSTGPYEREPVRVKVLREHGCRIDARGEEASCGQAPEGPVTLQLRSLVGIVQRADAWLLVYDDRRGGNRLRRLLVERRLPDWQLQRAWSATVVPPSDFPDEQEHVEELAFEGESMTVAIYSGYDRAPVGTGGGYWYTVRSSLKVPLPGLVP
jgi:hypothetical protein